MKKNKVLLIIIFGAAFLILAACGNGAGAGADTDTYEDIEPEIVEENDTIEEEDIAMNEDDFRVLEGTIVAILEEDEFLFVNQLNLSEELLERTPEEWFESDQVSDLYRLTDTEGDISVGTELQITFAITTMSIPPLVPDWDYEIMEDDMILNDDDLVVLEGTVVAVLEEDELLFVGQLNLSEELLEKTPEEWFEGEHVSDLYRLSDTESDISVGTEIRITFAITTMSIPPFVPDWDYEILR